MICFPRKAGIGDKSPPIPLPRSTSCEPKPRDPRQKLLRTHNASNEGEVVSPEYGRIDGEAKAAEPQSVWREIADLSDIENEKYGKNVFVMLERHQKMWSGHLGYIKGIAHRIELKQGTIPVRQQPYRAGSQRCELIEKHVNKMLSADVIEPSQSD